MRMLPTVRPAMLALDLQQQQGTRLGPRQKQLEKLRLLLRMRAVIETYRLTVMQQGGPPPSPGAGGVAAPGAEGAPAEPAAPAA